MGNIEMRGLEQRGWLHGDLKNLVNVQLGVIKKGSNKGVREYTPQFFSLMDQKVNSTTPGGYISSSKGAEKLTGMCHDKTDQPLQLYEGSFDFPAVPPFPVYTLRKWEKGETDMPSLEIK